MVRIHKSEIDTMIVHALDLEFKWCFGLIHTTTLAFIHSHSTLRLALPIDEKRNDLAAFSKCNQ